ncbi:TRAP transporter substrate-binding protein [uncultured Cohaesibacter sp.]|uniref:TRAP transporter substrate-binding protein n=1 Tax=uncultured Cohaesibacter sp. TaxID=1002546 RepID=UPI0029C87783|nr:TRAP transporter substrate-binding protein [uncultured Cohaesibacter sp.]
MSFIKPLFKNMVLAAGLVSISMTAGATELKLAHFSSTKYPLHVGMFVPLSEQVAAESNGDLTIRVYPGGELGAGPVKQYDRVVDGVADIAYTLPGYTASQFKKTLLLELPGVVPADQDPTAKFWQHVDMVSKEFRRTHLLGLWTNPPSVLLTKDKPIRTFEDLKGLKIRVSSRNVGRVAESWGATPVSMPITEVYNSLATGVIDGVLVDSSVLDSFKINEVANYLTKGMHSTSSPQMLLMNRDSWNALSEDEQKIIKKLTEEQMSQKGREIQAKGVSDAETHFAGMGKEVITLSPEEAAKFNAASEKLVGEIVKELESEGIEATAYVEALGQ